MKYVLILMLLIYTKIISRILDAFFGPNPRCRFEETCSQYSMRAIKEKGALKGILLSLLRLSKCHPFSKANLKYESI
ncbi:MAG: membrane protein insertion efficiency factor YidD [Candidatus Levyibacteriota bacterium]